MEVEEIIEIDDDSDESSMSLYCDLGDALSKSKTQFKCPRCLRMSFGENGIVLNSCKHSICKECIIDHFFKNHKDQMKCEFKARDLTVCGNKISENEILTVLTEFGLNELYETNTNYTPQHDETMLPLIRNRTDFCCGVCFLDCVVDQGVKLKECSHHVCEPCLRETISMNSVPQIFCPYSKSYERCASLLTDSEIKSLTTKEEYKKFKEIAIKDNEISQTMNVYDRVVKLPAIMESNSDEPDNSANVEQHTLTQADHKLGIHCLKLHSGKWRRKLSVHRRHSTSRRSASLLEQTDVESINNFKISIPNESDRQTLRHSVSFNSSGDNYADFNETSARRAARRRRTSVINPAVDVGRFTELDFVSAFKARDMILRKCGQSEPLEFSNIYTEGALRQCRKIGEGVYGEVFMNKTDEGRDIVLKIIPIEGSIEVNGEPQKKFDEILSEIVITQQLSSLRNDKEYMTSSFAEVVQVRCVQGRYPSHLIDLWELYRDNYQTENDHPEIFTDDKLYIVFELANGGQDLETFQFSNALQSKSAFQQTALALAIAEKKLQFEHRDLHWSNILLSPTDEKFVNFKLNGNTIQIPSEGIKVTIIDYTLSRTFYEGIVLYNDLSNDEELFTAHGDYQFDIYRLMKNNLDNNWQRFEPFNNILWLHYIIDKLINGARYKSTKSRKHRLAIEDLMVIRDEITNYESAVDSVPNM